MLKDELSHMTRSFLLQFSQDKAGAANEDDSDDGMNEILEDIQEALTIARLQGQIAPVRIARILAGEGTEQFSSDISIVGAPTSLSGQQTVPLSVALEYVGTILDESRSCCNRLKVRYLERSLTYFL